LNTGNAPRVRARVVIRGRVQGVFFRASAEAEANRLGLCGWVRNCPDGSVELVAEGSRAGVEKLLAWCAHGPPRAVVEDVDTHKEGYRGEFNRFSVRR
jgi:acylphosphatase